MIGLEHGLIDWRDLHGFLGIHRFNYPYSSNYFLETYKWIIMKHEEITNLIIKAYYKVYNTLGYGFLERVYENALFIELKKMDFAFEKQKGISVFYDDEIVGDYFADLIVENKIIIELKVSDNLVEENTLQLTNNLKATNIEVGLLLNFGKKPEIRRKIFDNDYK